MISEKFRGIPLWLYLLDNRNSNNLVHRSIVGDLRQRCDFWRGLWVLVLSHGINLIKTDMKKDSNDNPICKTEKETQMYRKDFWTLWEKARVGCFKRTASKHVYYLGWNRSPAQVGCMRQMLRPGALGRPRGIGRRGRWEGGLGWGNTCKTMADHCQYMTETTTILWSN